MPTLSADSNRLIRLADVQSCVIRLADEQVYQSTPTGSKVGENKLRTSGGSSRKPTVNDRLFS